MKVFTKLEEFLAANPKKAPEKPAPTTKPGTPAPTTKPGAPSPIRRDKPAVEPAPKASAEYEAAVATKPAPTTKPAQPTTKPGTSPSTKPGAPSPIRRDKPAVEPAPKAKAEKVVERFMEELKKAKAPINFDISKLKTKYKYDD